MSRGGLTRAVCKDMIPWIRTARRLGWDVSIGGGGHIRWTNTDGDSVFTSTTTRTRGHALRQMRAQLRRHGLPID